MKDLIDINFDEKEHKYFNNKGEVFISVTTLIDKYTNKFDIDFWAMYKALQDKGFKMKPFPEKQIIKINNVNFRIVDLYKDSLYKAYAESKKAVWKINTEEACFRGNVTHNELESGINISKNDVEGKTNSLIIPLYLCKGNSIEVLHNLEKANIHEKYPEAYRRLRGFVDRGFSIFAEKRIFLEKYKLAGMIDVPLFKKEYFCILDWKTNKDTLHETSGYYKKIRINNVDIITDTWVETGECFKYPLNHLQSSKFNKYALQLSTYSYILEQWGYKLIDNGLEIVHFPLGKPAKLLKIPYLKKEVEIMLNHYEQTNLLK